MPGPGRRAAASRRMKSSVGGRREKLLGAPKAQHSRDFTCVHDGESEAELIPDDFEEKPEREKKHTNFTLCNVCNIQLNSAAQAQIHYNGKSHQKRLKQLSNGMLKNDNGGTCQSPALPALVRPPAPPLQPSLDIKPFLPFPLDTAAAVNLFPNFNASQAAAHYKGTKHAKKLKALEAMKNKQKSVTAKDSAKTTFTSITTNTINTSSDKTDGTAGTPAISTTTTVEIRKSSVMTTEITSKVEKSPTTATGNSSCPSTETEEEKAKRLLYCSLCKVAVNSASQLEAHNSGTKHKTMLEARNGSGTIKAFPRAGVKGKGPVNKGNTGLQNKTFHCEICDVHVNSETQLKQHISSRRHKDRAAGKPPKPKYSPYNKLQKTAHPLGVKLVFSKEPSKPLAPRILPNPLAAAAAAAAVAVSSPFSLRTAPAATLFQTSALPPALLRPAPGPIRTAHTPVLFAPY
ncbi:PREDICTED: zinc finger protein 385D isoform X2 [Cercocebus atys]|uniref:zinc finger protein 385D isoform X2 n=1 Tax=Cercocebus atys TaxID=9531 RepID=UPI0005F4D06C|nr:PREDICTED: zinc finger protein 385D isoform X2 [Cercocebus atys]XP_045241138.1 zinc finger protein 385D isoform X2 [Macaca fascicularis]